MEKLLSNLMPGTGKCIRQSRRELLSACHFRGPVVVFGERGTGKDHTAKILHELKSSPDSLFRSIDMAISGEWEKIQPDYNGKCTFYLDHCESFKGSGRTLTACVGASMPSRLQLILSVKTSPKEEGQNPPVSKILGVNYISIGLSPLRKRRDDIPSIMGYLSRNFYHGAHLDLGPDDIDYLYAHSWPGNMKELKEWMNDRLLYDKAGTKQEAAVSQRTSLSRIFDREIEAWVDSMIGDCSPGISGVLRKITDRLEKIVIRTVIKKTNGNQVEAASVLGINRNTLAKKIKKYGLSRF